MKINSLPSLFNLNINNKDKKTKTIFIMKQPALGQKIIALRKEKGLTQEELVEKCNISVRTIQRIEAGEVSPRSYTIKTILEALDYDLDQIKEDTPKATQEFKKMLLLDIDDSKGADFLIKQLNISWISGIIYFVLGFIEVTLDFFRYKEDELIINPFLYGFFKICVLAAIILYIRGFVLSGKLFKNYLLRITAFIMIVLSGFFYIYDIASLFIGNFDYQFILGAQSISYGIIGILLGISVLRLQKSLGTIATVTGIFEIITYGLMTTIILAIVGLFLISPMLILEVILLYKITAMLKAKIAINKK